ncbi:MAG: DNA modification methylase [Anaerolineae bacterium]|nr:MAG: DNA modification methylase [Anaerolineae bacterium]
MTSIQNRIVGYRVIKASELQVHPDNWREHPTAQDTALRGILAQVGWVDTALYNVRTGRMIDGHLRKSIAAEDEIPVLDVDLSEDEERLVLATLDPIGAMVQANPHKLAVLREQLSLSSEPLNALLEKYQQEGAAILQALTHPAAETPPAIPLIERFIIPPFSVLDARQAYWQERKRAWLALGIESELGRGSEDKKEGGLVFTPSAQGESIYRLRNEMRATLGYDPSWDEIISEAQHRGMHVFSGTSVFDPVLCEIAYRWFCPAGGSILDPFAGGSVRGIVATALGYAYTGIELRAEQVSANHEQAARIVPEALPIWLTGDSSQMDSLLPSAYQSDFLFTCPPYFDLEKYSDDNRDLSRASSYAAFLETYRAIVALSCARLHEDRLACFVVGDIRDRHGHYRNFVADTVAAFRDCGLELYNEAVLITALGSLPIRVGKMFEASRKLGKTHQNVLVFVKGDWHKAVQAVGPIVVANDIAETMGW